MEHMDVRIARLEESVVRVHDKVDASNKLYAGTANDVRYIRDKLDTLTERHWKLYGIVAAISFIIKFIKIGGN